MSDDYHPISEDLLNAMFHIIGYANLEESFLDAMFSDWDVSKEALLELAKMCDERWGMDIVGRINKVKARKEE